MKIHIKGIPRSGKTYICNNITVECYDTDDYITKAYDLLRTSKYTDSNIRKKAKELFLQDIK